MVCEAREARGAGGAGEIYGAHVAGGTGGLAERVVTVIEGEGGAGVHAGQRGGPSVIRDQCVSTGQGYG